MPENNSTISLKDIDLKAICLNNDFGTLKFNQALPQLEKIREDLVELEDLNYKELDKNSYDQVEDARGSYLRFIEQIKAFSVNQSNPQSIRDNLEREIANFYNNTFPSKTRLSLIYLKQKINFDQKTEEELRATVSSAKKIEKELQEKLAKIKEDENAVEKGQGIVSSKFLSQEFEEQFKIHENEAEKKWFYSMMGSLLLLVLFCLGSFFGYLFWVRPSQDKYLLIEWGVFSLLIIAIVFYILRFSVRNFNIHKNLASINRHRRNVAETLIHFIGAIGSESHRNILMQDASKALFEHQSTGYLDKDQMQISTPIQEMVTNIIKDKT